MRLYLTISRGLRADRATPIVAVSDQRLIRWLLSQFVLVAEDDAMRDLDCKRECSDKHEGGGYERDA